MFKGHIVNSVGREDSSCPSFGNGRLALSLPLAVDTGLLKASFTNSEVLQVAAEGLGFTGVFPLGCGCNGANLHFFKMTFSLLVFLD